MGLGAYEVRNLAPHRSLFLPEVPMRVTLPPLPQAAEAAEHLKALNDEPAAEDSEEDEPIIRDFDSYRNASKAKLHEKKYRNLSRRSDGDRLALQDAKRAKHHHHHNHLDKHHHKPNKHERHSKHERPRHHVQHQGTNGSAATAPPPPPPPVSQDGSSLVPPPPPPPQGGQQVPPPPPPSNGHAAAAGGDPKQQIK